MTGNMQRTDVLVIGWGLAGLVAASEALAAGRHVTLIDQEPRFNLGGQAWWSFGGLFFVDSPEQRRGRVATEVGGGVSGIRPP